METKKACLRELLLTEMKLVSLLELLMGLKLVFLWEVLMEVTLTPERR